MVARPFQEPALVTCRIVDARRRLGLSVGGAYSQTFPDRAAARAAVVAASREQKVPDEDTLIEYADPSGRWIIERADGHDRPETEVVDDR